MAASEANTMVIERIGAATPPPQRQISFNPKFIVWLQVTKGRTCSPR